jgi:hypothetical protein
MMDQIRSCALTGIKNRNFGNVSVSGSGIAVLELRGVPDSFYVGNEDALIAAIVQLGSSGVGVAGHALGSF